MGQRCGGTAGLRTAVTVHGALPVIGVALVPLGLEQRLDNGSGTHHGLCLGKIGAQLQLLELGLVLLQPETHVLGNRVQILDRAVAIGENLLSTVIARNDHKAALGVENVIHGTVVHLGVHLGMSEGHLLAGRALELTTLSLLLHEALSGSLSSLGPNGRSG